MTPPAATTVGMSIALAALLFDAGLVLVSATTD